MPNLSLDFLHVKFGMINSKWGIGPQNSVPLNWDDEGLLSASYKRHIVSVDLNLLCAGTWGRGTEKNPFQVCSQHRRQAGNGAGAQYHWQSLAHPTLCCQSLQRFIRGSRTGQAKQEQLPYPACGAQALQCWQKKAKITGCNCATASKAASYSR